MAARKFYFLRAEENDYQVTPAFPSDRGLINKLKKDHIYEATIVQPRNGKFHRKFFALLNMTLENLPENFHIIIKSGKYAGRMVYIETLEGLLDNLKILVGHVEYQFSVTGEMYIKPKSISFAKMDEAEFSEFYDRCIDKILANFLVGLTEKEIAERVLDYL